MLIAEILENTGLSLEIPKMPKRPNRSLLLRFYDDLPAGEMPSANR
jgi:hypothetical protein